MNHREAEAVTAVLFVCLHGSAKSVIAAEYARRLAGERGIRIEATSAGLEPDTEMPDHVVRGLARDGVDVNGRQPHACTRDTLRAAQHVVALGCDVTALLDNPRDATNVVRWDDLPAVSDGYEAARDAIVSHLRTLLDDLRPQ